MPISSLTAVILIIAAFMSAILGGMTGMAGGVVFLGVLTLFVDVAYVVPLHSVVMLVGNVTKMCFFYRHINWRIVAFFLLGLLPGALVGIYVFRLLPKDIIKLMMGIFILLATFLPRTGPKKRKNEKLFTPLGLAAGLIGVFFGASGPLTAPFYIRQGIIKEELIATKSTCQLFEHLLKICLFSLVGISIFHEADLLILLSVAVIIGTFVGKKLLNKLSDRVFIIIFKTFLCVIALRIIILQLIKILG